MRRIFRDNPLLAVSIALPVAVVLLFAAASAIPRLLTDPPAHDLLLTVEQGHVSRTVPVRVIVGVENNRVVARAIKLDKHETGYLPRLFRYDHASESVQEITIPLPADAASLENRQEIEIPALAGLQVTSELRAPDGYEYRGQNYNRGLMVELFGGGGSLRKITVERNGAVVPIRLPETDHWYYGASFLAWVIGEEP